MNEASISELPVKPPAAEVEKSALEAQFANDVIIGDWMPNEIGMKISRLLWLVKTGNIKKIESIKNITGVAEQYGLLGSENWYIPQTYQGRSLDQLNEQGYLNDILAECASIAEYFQTKIDSIKNIVNTNDEIIKECELLFDEYNRYLNELKAKYPAAQVIKTKAA